MKLNPERFREALQEAQLLTYFPHHSLASLVSFTQKMLELNQNINLTKWTSENEVLTNHLLDSAHCLPIIQTQLREKNLNKSRWLDLGTGCGFPGAVLAAVFPRWEVTFLDSVTKKIKVLEECVKAAGWSSPLLAVRAEELGNNPTTRESWNGITARAVSDFRVVLEYAMPLLVTGGYLLNWMTEDQLSVLDNSKRALTELKAQIVYKRNYQLPHNQNHRWIIIVEKLGTTPESYPRPVGKALKSPLL